MTWSRTHQGRKLIRFTAVSVVSTLVSVIVISFLYGLKIIRSEVDATLIANVIGAIPSYALNRRWTWGKTGHSHFMKEVVPFTVLAVAGIAFSVFGAAYAKHVVHTHHLSHLLNTAIVDAANLASFAIFWVLKLIVFNRIFRLNEETQIDEHLLREESPPLA